MFLSGGYLGSAILDVSRTFDKRQKWRKSNQEQLSHVQSARSQNPAPPPPRVTGFWNSQGTRNRVFLIAQLLAGNPHGK